MISNIYISVVYCLVTVLQLVSVSHLVMLLILLFHTITLQYYIMLQCYNRLRYYISWQYYTWLQYYIWLQHHITDLLPEDPERTSDNDCRRYDDVTDELTRNDRIFSLAWWLADHIVVHWFHTQTKTTENVFHILIIDRRACVRSRSYVGKYTLYNLKKHKYVCVFCIAMWVYMHVSN